MNPGHENDQREVERMLAKGFRRGFAVAFVVVIVAALAWYFL